jgi:hypothetical protein
MKRLEGRINTLSYENTVFSSHLNFVEGALDVLLPHIVI